MEKGFSSEAWDALADKRTKATSPAAVVECLKTGMTAEATARHLGIRQSVIESIAAQVHDLGRQPQALLGAWRTGSTLKDLSDKYSMTVFDIWRAIDREILNGCIRDRRGISKLTYSDVQALCQRHPSAVTVMMQEHNASRPEAEERVALARDYNKSVRSKRDSAKADKRQRNLILSESASPLFTAKEQRMLKYFDDGLWTSDITERMRMKDDGVFDTLCGLIRRRDALLEPLTPIELKILDRWDKGMSTADIAANLHLEVAGLQTLIVTLLRQRRALADAKPSDTGDTRTSAERIFDHDITALNKSIKGTAQEVRVMIRGAALEGRPEVKTEFTTGIPRFGGGEASTTSAEGDTNMSELTYNRARVIETGKANLDAHTKALAATTEAAAAAIKAYTAKVAPALVRGEQPETKAPEIKVIADQTKTYEKHLRQLEHLSGDTVPSTPAVDFLLKDPEEVNRGVETVVTLSVD